MSLPAFTHPHRLPLSSPHPFPRPFHSPFPFRRRRCPAALCNPTPKKATLFSNGQRLTLTPTPSNAPPSATRYIVCPSCAAAYVGNAVVSPITLVCLKCTHRFTTSPSSLYLPAPSGAANFIPLEQPPDAIRCPHFKHCPGCTVTDNVSNPPVIQSARPFLRQLGLREWTSVTCGDATAWRSHAKLAVRPGRDGPTLGLFRGASHTLVPIPQCVVHTPVINAAARAAERSLRAAGASAYEEGGGGECRYVLLSEGGGGVHVTFVWNASNWKESLPVSKRVAGGLWKMGVGGDGEGGVKSVWFNWNTSLGNAILAPDRGRFYRMYGREEGLLEELRGVPFWFPPYVFRQANLAVFGDKLLPVLLGYVREGGTVAEFCAGVGVIGLVALKERNLKRLIASEINAAAEESFWKTYRVLRKMGVKGEAEYMVGSDVETVGIVDDEVDTVIVDPPRAGLSEPFVQALAKMENPALRRVIYVSCGFTAFRKDARILCAGHWKLKCAHAFVLFPGSDHVETLAVFDRDANKRRRAPAHGRQQRRSPPAARRSSNKY